MSQFVETPTKMFTANGAIDQYRRVKLSSGKVAVSGATDPDIGTIERETFADGDVVAVRLMNAQGTRKMVAADSFSAGAALYGAASGKVSDTANENFIGTALEAATTDGDVVEVLVQVLGDDLQALGAIDGEIVIDEDFIGDWDAAGTALTGAGAYSWSKLETDGLGVTSVDVARGVLKFAADAQAEVAVASLFMENSPLDPSKGGIAEFIIGVWDIGDAAAVDFDFGLASDDHATNFETIAEFVAFHLDGTDLSLKIHSDDGTTDTAAVDTTVDLVDDTFYAFRIDYNDLSDVKFYYRALGAAAWTRLLSGTTFDVSAATANWTPIVMAEKSSDDTTFDFRCDRIRVQAPRL